MRNAFAAELEKLADENPNLVFLSGDIGNKLFDKFKAKHPARFYNCGVAEQGLMGLAAGMGLCGLRPIAYTITPFITTRCLEQIRVDVCYHKSPVIIVGVGAGLSYATLGTTHHACEDISFLRSLPGMSVVAPADPIETKLALRAALSWPGPVYIRLGKKGEPNVHAAEPKFEIGKAIKVSEGKSICILGTGTIMPEAVAAGTKLDAEVYSFHTIKPLDEDVLQDVFARFPVVATIEEHSRIGGLGGAVAEWLADHPSRARLLRFGTPDEFMKVAGEQDYARKLYGLDAESLAKAIAAALDKASAKAA
jgi:transketolase